MSIRIPLRALAQPGASLHSLTKPSLTLTLPYHTRRTLTSTSSLSEKFTPKRPEAKEEDNLNPDSENPVLDAYLRKSAARKTEGVAQPQVEPGSLPTDTIFGDGLRWMPTEDAKKEPAPSETPAPKPAIDSEKLKNRELMAARLDPHPEMRRAWERKMVIRTIRRRGKMTKDEILMRTERQSLYKSPFLATSVKKLTKLANQIAGKSVEEAMVQLRFSKKKAARDMLVGLKNARDEAVIRKGMGLGKVEDTAGKPVEIEDKDGKRRVVEDRTGIYVDQAWVGRGAYTSEPEFRARGKVNILKHPSTSFSVLLKEEATRIRLSDERKKKRDNRKLWVQLPDRPITAQRQYCLW